MKRILLLLVISTWACAVHAQNAPNFILVIVDDLNIPDGGFNDLSPIVAPNIARLKNNGITFSNAHSNSTVCGPSRASMISGLYPATTGYYGYRMGINPWEIHDIFTTTTDLFKHFKNNGYNVYGSGKIYHGFIPEGGFTEYFDAGPLLGPFAWDGVSYQGSFPAVMSYPSSPFSSVADDVAPLSDIPTIGDYTGWINQDGSEFHYENDSVRDLLHDEKVLNYATTLINELSSDDPFMLTLGIFKPHAPFILPKKHFDLYDIQNLELPPILATDLSDVAVSSMNNRWNDVGNYDGFRTLLAASADSSDNEYWLKRYAQGYYAGISYVDELLGKLLDSLEASIHADNTYIILVSDHGYHLGEKTLIKKTTLWERSTHIPFIVSGPGIPSGTLCTSPVSLIDLYPTLVDLSDLDNPSNPLDGFSLVPLLFDPVNGNWDGPEVTLTSVACDEVINPGQFAKAAHQHHVVSSETMRYLLYSSGEEELYDLEIDQNEWFNLSADPQYAVQKADLREKLLTIADISGEVNIADTSNQLFYGGFEQELNGWVLGPNNFASGAQIIQNGNQTEGQAFLSLSTSVAGSLRNSNVILEEGVEYTLSFDGRRLSGSSTVEVKFIRDNEPGTSDISSEIFTLNSEWNSYSFDFTYLDSTIIYSTTMQVFINGAFQGDFDNFRLVKSCSEQSVTLHFPPDLNDYSDIEWTIYADDQSVAASFENQVFSFQPDHRKNICLMEGCYSIEVIQGGSQDPIENFWYYVTDRNGDTLTGPHNFGQAEFCADLVINTETTINDLYPVLLFPNPSNGNDLNYSLNKTWVQSNSENGKINVYSQSGQLVYNKQFLNQNTSGEIKLPSLSPGIYFVQFSMGQKRSTHKLVLQ